MNRIIIVGSGFSGSILARKIVEELNRPVTILEKRSHIGGNMYDKYDKNGILIQKYGPHFLNTDHYYVIEYLQQFARLFPHNAKLLSFIDGNYVQLPFNFTTVQQLLGAKQSGPLLEKLRAAFKGRDRVPVLELVKHSDSEISAYGTLLFEKAYRTYTSKMWGIQPEEIDQYVLDRVPMAMNYDERYLNKDFQYLPEEGFTKLFEKLLEHPDIEICLNTDALEHLELDRHGHMIRCDGKPVDCVVYTGAIDELFGCKYGTLPYRSLDIRYTWYDKESVLPCEIISYPQTSDCTRSTEYRKMMFDSSRARGSVIATEYPLNYDPAAEKGNIPYYPVVTEESRARYQMYLREVSEYENLFLCGRLAEFRYYNMDICIEHALQYFENIRVYLEKKTHG